ncbi:MAG: hypothetical protein R3219_04545 [Hydrogenovibrio sp.]|nr:hypothetical protein [Hydrogenovibrio sp.]
MKPCSLTAGPEMIRRLLGVMGLCLLAFSAFAAEPSDNVQPIDVAALKDEALHTQLVYTAIEYDVFNQRCRGVSASYNQSKVSRLFLDKYGITLNDYIINFLSEETDVFRKKVTNQVYRAVAQMGGCQPARNKGLEQKYKTDFRKLYAKVEKSPWFPITQN